MDTKRLIAALVVAALMTVALVALSGCPQQQEQVEEIIPPEPEPIVEPTGETGKIVQVGSTTVLPIAEAWRKAFNEAHPTAERAVTGGVSGAGIEALTSGTCDIANASRPIKDKEKSSSETAGIDPVEHVVAHDGIAVIVHPDNPLSSIDFQKLSDMFVGDITSSGDVGASGLGNIQLIGRDSSSGTYEAFKEIVVTLEGEDKDRDFAASALREASNEAVLKAVSQTTTGIGYVGLGYVDDSVKVIAVAPMGGGDAVAPAVETVKDGSYPIARKLFMYTNGEPQGAVAEYFDWGLGPEGQAIVADLGFVPVN